MRPTTYPFNKSRNLMPTQRFPLALFALLLAACPPSDGGTTETASTPSTSIGPSTSIASLDTSDTAIPTTGDPDTTTSAPTTSTTSTDTTGGADGPCADFPNNPECMCEATDADFCAKLDTFCRTKVGLDLSQQNPPGTDYCDTIAAWCATPGTNTYAVCFLLESTCMQVAPSGDVADCAGLGDTCACNDFAQSESTGGGSGSSGGETGVDLAVFNGCALPDAGSLWGPCTADHRCDGDETGLFGCMYVPNSDAPQGSLCAPLCTAAGCSQAGEAVWCDEPQGSPACEKTGACALVCATNDDCGVGLECFGTRCLWPG